MAIPQRSVEPPFVPARERSFERGQADGCAGVASVGDMGAWRTMTTKVHERFQPGQGIAGRFTVVRFIANGGMGEVYEVEDRFLQSVHVALKVIRPEIAEDATSSWRFEQEVLLARKVAHRNLCPIYDIARCTEPAPPFLFLTMKLLTGETLAARLHRAGPMRGEEAVSVFRQVISGVAALHAGGVIHRDLKPNNVMLEGSGTPMCLSIMDFGLARLHQTDTTQMTQGLVAGTPGYLAPELMHGHPPSQETDIFALGVLLHQVLTGQNPISEAFSAGVKPTDALGRAEVPATMRRAVAEFLSEAPERRCAAFQEMQATMEAGTSLDGSRVRNDVLLTRRQFALGSAAAVTVLGTGAVWKRDWLNDRMHPLPRKRFVALLAFPPPESGLKPMLSGVIDAMAGELSRAEAQDRNLLIMAQQTLKWATNPTQLNEAREALGANLVMAASSVAEGGLLVFSLKLFDQLGQKPLRESSIKIRAEEQVSLPERATQLAAKLLGIAGYRNENERTRAGTSNHEAYAAFQEAEALRKQQNDTGLDDAIVKYQKALELDPRYAEAQAGLAWAYLRLYGIKGEAAALRLARENALNASGNNPGSVDAQLALAWCDVQTGDFDNATAEMAKALALDPADVHTLSYQGKFEARVGRYAEAEATFLRALRLRPNYWLARQELAVIYHQEGKYALALTEFRSASLAAPKNAMALGNVGGVYLELGQLDKATEVLEASLKLRESDWATASLAEIARVQGRMPAAIAYALQAVKLNPSEPSNCLELGDCYAALGKGGREMMAAYRHAVRLAEEHVLTEKKDGPGWMLLALCRLKAGEGQMAPALIAKAESFFAGDITSQLYKVRALELLGNRDAALATMVECLKRGPTGFQLRTMPDLDAMRRDPRYLEAMQSNASATESSV